MVGGVALLLFLGNQDGASSRVVICEKIAQFLGSGNLVEEPINLLFSVLNGDPFVVLGFAPAGGFG